MAGDTERAVEHSKADEGMDVTPVEDVALEPIVKVDSFRDDRHINLTWRSWVVVLWVFSCRVKRCRADFENSVSCFA
jgi:hypothetical protein